MTCIIMFNTVPVPESTPTDVVETEPRPTRDDEETTLIDRVLEVTMPAKAVRDLTIRELCSLAYEVRSSEAGSKKLQRAADTMAIASMYLERCGALQQMMWWAPDAEAEAPPDGKVIAIPMLFPSPPGSPRPLR